MRNYRYTRSQSRQRFWKYEEKYESSETRFLWVFSKWKEASWQSRLNNRNYRNAWPVSICGSKKERRLAYFVYDWIIEELLNSAYAEYQNYSYYNPNLNPNPDPNHKPNPNADLGPNLNPNAQSPRRDQPLIL